jgi:hypothetical protein
MNIFNRIKKIIINNFMCNSNEEHFKKILSSLEKEESELLLFAYNFTKKAHN